MSANRIYNRFPEFIHGEAIGEQDEFILHTRYPRFLARVVLLDNFSGVVCMITPGTLEISNSRPVAYHNPAHGLRFIDIVLLDRYGKENQPDPAAISQACDKAVGSLLLLEEATEAMLVGDSL